ncbi:MAG: hypothetical protein CM1200mP2_33030 [Planctomycetaceae bacterium]|nr:MAG: hypothetical protein CM1200mP2_33030 [Planctomycetaceae bacterium]
MEHRFVSISKPPGHEARSRRSRTGEFRRQELFVIDRRGCLGANPLGAVETGVWTRDVDVMGGVDLIVRWSGWAPKDLWCFFGHSQVVGMVPWLVKNVGVIHSGLVRNGRIKTRQLCAGLPFCPGCRQGEKCHTPRGNWTGRAPVAGGCSHVERRADSRDDCTAGNNSAISPMTQIPDATPPQTTRTEIGVVDFWCGCSGSGGNGFRVAKRRGEGPVGQVGTSMAAHSTRERRMGFPRSVGARQAT